MGEILKSLIFTLTEPRPTDWMSPRKFSHIPNSRRLYLFLFDTLKHQDDSEMSVQSSTQPWCVQNTNDDVFIRIREIIVYIL